MAVEEKPVTLTLDLATGALLDRFPAKPRPPEPTLVGQRLPEPVVRRGAWIPEAPPSLAELAAKRVVLVAANSWLCEGTDEAWAWPRLSEWTEDHGPEGLSVLFVMGLAEKAGDVESFVRERKVAYPVLHDPLAANAKAWGAGGIAVAFLLDRDGEVVWQGRIGPQGDAAGCKAAIRAQLAARAGTLSRGAR
jgi:hypothetical protein